MIVEFVVPGEPQSKQRPQHGANRNTFTPKKTRDAEKVIAGFARQAMGGREPVSCRVGVTAQFYCGTRHHKDFDNMVKTLTDAMNKLVYVDDWLIEEVFVRVVRGVGDLARTECCVYELDLLE